LGFKQGQGKSLFLDFVIKFSQPLRDQGYNIDLFKVDRHIATGSLGCFKQIVRQCF
jgi:hypothetical protein